MLNLPKTWCDELNLMMAKNWGGGEENSLEKSAQIVYRKG